MLSIYLFTCNLLYPQSTLAFDFSRYDEHICVWESPYRGFLSHWKSKQSKPIECFLLILHKHVSHYKRWNQNPTNRPLTVPLSMNSENLMHAKQSNILKDFWCLFACVSIMLVLISSMCYNSILLLVLQMLSAWYLLIHPC